MNDESSPIQSVYGTYRINTMFLEPQSLHINIDKYGGSGIKDFHITVKDYTFVFSTEEIYEILNNLKQRKLR